MADIYLKHAKSVGVDFEAHGSTELPGAATDMGNVSYVVPSIHPLFFIGANVFNHTREFTEASGKHFLSFQCIHSYENPTSKPKAHSTFHWKKWPNHTT